jgi:hypothetical protein
VERCRLYLFRHILAVPGPDLLDCLDFWAMRLVTIGWAADDFLKLCIRDHKECRPTAPFLREEPIGGGTLTDLLHPHLSLRNGVVSTVCPVKFPKVGIDGLHSPFLVAIGIKSGRATSFLPRTSHHQPRPFRFHSFFHSRTLPPTSLLNPHRPLPNISLSLSLFVARRSAFSLLHF